MVGIVDRNRSRGARLRSLACSPLVQSISTVAVLTAAVKLVTVVKDMVVARGYGRGDDLEAFLIAALLPMTLASLIGGSFVSAVVPPLTRLIGAGQYALTDIRRLLAAATTLALGLISIVAAALWFAGPLVVPIIASGFDTPKRALTIEVLHILLAMLVFSGLAGFWSSILNATRNFAYVATAPAAIPAFTLLAVVAAGKDASAQTLAWGTVTGSMVYALVLGFAVWRRKLLTWPTLTDFSGEGRRLIGQYGFVIAGGAVMATTELIDMSMAAILGPGSVAALSFGTKITLLFTGIGSIALGTAVLPHFSRFAAAGDWPMLLASLKHQLGVLALATIPLVLLLVLAGEPVIALLFQGGEFSVTDTGTVAAVHRFYALQIPFVLGGIVIVRALSAVGANHVLTMAAAMNALANIALNFLFMRWLGVAGIALATTCVYFLSAAFCLVMLQRWIRQKQRNHGTD